jgi:hypothetical protein
VITKISRNPKSVNAIETSESFFSLACGSSSEDPGYRDNRLNREAFKGLFTRHFPSIVVEEASDGRETAQKVESFQPDLILMDI